MSMSTKSNSAACRKRRLIMILVMILVKLIINYDNCEPGVSAMVCLERIFTSAPQSKVNKKVWQKRGMKRRVHGPLTCSGKSQPGELFWRWRLKLHKWCGFPPADGEGEVTGGDTLVTRFMWNRLHAIWVRRLRLQSLRTEYGGWNSLTTVKDIKFAF